MKVRNLLVFGSLLITVVLFSFRKPPKVTVADILRDPAYYNGKKVEVEGIVQEYDISADEIICYLKGPEDSILRVRITTPLTSFFCRYKMTGIVHAGLQKGKVFLEELQAVEEEVFPAKSKGGEILNSNIMAKLEVE